MGLFLGLDGKRRAIQVNTAESPNDITDYYVGLLETLPANYDGLTLSELVTGNEHAPSSDWYDGGRQEITFDGLTSDASGASSTNDSVVSWDNDSGDDQSVAGVFVTDVQSGTTGQVLWVGPPDVGTMIIDDGSPAVIDIGDMVLQVD